MEIDNKQICNVCLKVSSPEDASVYIKAVCRGEDIHVCTACIPHVIHGSGDIVKSNEEIKKKL